MASFTAASKYQLCSSCMRRAFLGDVSLPRPLAQYQVRGKKKLAKRTTINVKLLADVRGYGPKGSIVPVAPGLFRNDWLPRQRAEYLSPLQGIYGSKADAVRDTTFRKKSEENEKEDEQDHEARSEKEGQKQVEMTTIPPDQATRLLISTVPTVLTFYRRPLSQPQSPASTADHPSSSPEEDRQNDASRSPKTTSQISEGPSPDAKGNSIYGSVSTADIAEKIRKILLRDEHAKVVSVAVENIWFMKPEKGEDQKIEDNRVKVLGDFRIGLRVKGGTPVVRTVSVRSQIRNGQEEPIGDSFEEPER